MVISFASLLKSAPVCCQCAFEALNLGPFTVSRHVATNLVNQQVCRTNRLRENSEPERLEKEVNRGGELTSN